MSLKIKRRVTHFVVRGTVCGQKGNWIRQTMTPAEVTCKKCRKKLHRGIQTTLDL